MDVKLEHTAPSIPLGVYCFLATRALSALGSGMTAFTINILVFEKTHSYALFAGLTLLTSVPNLLLAPVVGIVVDGYNKKHLLRACEGVTAVAVLFALVAFLCGSFGLLQAGVVVFALSVASNFRWTLIGATIGNLVPRSSLNRVNGIQQSFQGTAEIGAPLLGAAALYALGPICVFTVDVVTSVIAIIAISTLDGQTLSPKCIQSSTAGFLHNALYGARWMMGHGKLRRLIFFLTAYNLAGGVYTVSFVPHFLSISNRGSLGAAFALEAAGALLGGLIVARTRYRESRSERTVYFCAGIFGVIMVAWGFAGSNVEGFIVAATSGITVSALIASLQTIWQAHVPAQMQGRVFAARRMISYCLIPIATVVSIPFAAHVTGPLARKNLLLQTIWGTAESAGLGMLLSLLGAFLILISIFASVHARNIVVASASPVESGIPLP